MSIDLKQINQAELAAAISGVLTQALAPVFTDQINNSGLSFGPSVVYATGQNQTVSGQKTFVLSPNIPYSGGSGQAVSMQYVLDKITSLGIGGIQNFTGGSVSSYFYVPNPVVGSGAVNLDYLRSLNVLYATGNQVVSGTNTFTGNIYVPNATSGFQAVPFVQFALSGNNYVSGLNASGQSLLARIQNLEYISVTGSGSSGVSALNNLTGHLSLTGAGAILVINQANGFIISGGLSTGAPGPSGESFHYRGAWNTGITYSYFDWVNETGISYIALSGHTSSAGNRPYSGSSLWALLASGSGPSGATGASAILFNWKGNWNSGNIYSGMDAVFYSGNAYGYTGASPSSGIDYSPTLSNNWSIVVNGQPIDTTAFYPTTNPSGFITGFNSGQFLLISQTGFFAPVFHNHPYATGIKIGNTILTGTVSFAGAGSVVVSTANGIVTISGLMAAGSGGGGSSLSYKGTWSPTSLYISGDTVSYNSSLYINNTNSILNGTVQNPITVSSPWTRFGERELNAYSGDYNSGQIYYYKDLVRYNDAGNIHEFLNLNSYTAPLQSLHPYGYYNYFIDCNGATGKNLFSITVDVKTPSHPFYGSGDLNTYLINGIEPNKDYSGYGTLTLIRGQTYFFDKETGAYPFILTTNSSGGSFNGEVTNGVLSGARLLVDNSTYSTIGLNNSLASGTFKFTPNSTHPDTLYYQSSSSPFVGFKLLIVDSNPWNLFSSGTIGPIGPQGIPGPTALTFNWKGNWDVNTSYSPKDAVYYNGSSWATNNYTSFSTPAEGSLSWFILSKSGAIGATGAKGINWRGNWSSGNSYLSNDATFYNGNSFIAINNNTNVLPSTGISFWNLLASGTIGPTGTGVPGLAFVWKGQWASTTNYNSNEAVYYQGSSYATSSGISGTVPTATSGNPWFTIAKQGGTVFSWRGTYTNNTLYSNGDAVFYNGSSYATNANSSGATPDVGPSWFLVAQKGDAGPIGPSGNPATGVNWRGVWVNNKLYNRNDLVQYNGSTFIATGTTSGASPFLSGWNTFTSKADSIFNWQGAYNVGIAYNPNSTVYYNGSSYATLTYITAGILPDYTGVSNTWFLTAKGNPVTSIRHTFYQRSPNVGNDMGQFFFEKSGVFSGCFVSSMNTGILPISGNLYIVDPKNNLTGFLNFSLPTGSYQTSFIYNQFVPANYRVGYNVNQIFSGASGLSLAILGYMV